MNKTGFNIEQPAVLNYVNQDYQELLVGNLERSGFVCYLLDGSNIYDKESFTTEIGKTLLNAKDIGSWDELEDSYVNWLLHNGDEPSALIWSHVHQMLDGNLEDLIEVADILMGITRRLYAKKKICLSFFLGEGLNFPIPAQIF